MKIKFKSQFQASMWITAITSFLCMVTSFILNYLFQKEFLYVLGITALTIFYHFAIRLFLGEWLLMKLIPEKINYDRKWFQLKQFEKKLYELLNVKKWKSNMPTYSPDEFSTEKRSWEEIVVSTCRSEIVHECNVILSFIPIIFTIPFGSFLVFLLTSIGAAVFDLIFVIMQRYNRPRLLKIVKHIKKYKNPSE